VGVREVEELEKTKKAPKMNAIKNFGFATIAASGLAAAIVGLAAPAQAAVEAPTATLSAITVPAGIDHHDWLGDIGPHVNVPQVNTSVQQSR
jgi:hypothetical protein